MADVVRRELSFAANTKVHTLAGVEFLGEWHFCDADSLAILVEEHHDGRIQADDVGSEILHRNGKALANWFVDPDCHIRTLGQE
jgi:hypothetical protein